MEQKTLRQFTFSLMLIGFLLAGTIATQYTASELGYQDALYWYFYSGEDFRIYFPFAFIAWDLEFGHEARYLFTDAYTIFALLVLLATFIVGAIRMSIGKKTTDNYGSARWAVMSEIKDSHLLDGYGLMLGTLPTGEYIRDNEKTHVFVCAPSRSGKGVGIIIPTLLYWPDSTVVVDVKGENWAFTSGYRKEKLNNVCIKFDPTCLHYEDKEGHFTYDGSDSGKFNPFDEIRIGTPKEVADTQNICRILVDPTGKGYEGNNAHWTNNACELLVGIVLHLKYSREYVTIRDVVGFFSEDINGLQAHLMRIIIEARNGNIVHDETGRIIQFTQRLSEETYFHPVVMQCFIKMASTPDKEFGSIQSTLETALSIYRDPVIAENMSSSDFNINDLMNHDKPVSLYLVVPPSDLERLMPVFRLILELLYKRNVEKMEFDPVTKKTKDNKHRLLMLMDEFPLLGKMETFETAMGVIAGYGIKALIICQSIQQINKTYQKSNGIISNCETRIFYAPNDEETPKYLSGLMGKTTVVARNRSTGGALINIGDKGYSYSEIARDLMTPDEISALNKGQEIILKTSYRPILANKIKWYENVDFKDRALPPPKEPDVIKHPAQKNWQNEILNKLPATNINTEESIEEEDGLSDDIEDYEEEGVDPFED